MPEPEPTATAERPLGGYAILTGVFAALSGSFTAWFVRSGRKLPAHAGIADLAFVSVATHKLARIITRDRVTSTLRDPFTEHKDDAGHGEVDEAPRGRGLRRAIGELLVCPYCIALWIAGAFTAALLVVPRAARWVAFVFTAVTVSDFLQVAYKQAIDAP